MKHFKRPLSILLTLLMILPIAVMGVSAETSTPDVDAVTPGTVLYSQDFENDKASVAMFPNTSTAYPGTYAFSGPADAFGLGGTRSAKFWREGSNASTWAFPTICSADALQGQTHYTIKFNLTGSFSGGNYFGIRFGGYDDASAKGHYVVFGYNYYMYSYYYNGSNNRTWLGKNGSGENTGKAEREASDAMTMVIDVDSSAKVAKVYLTSSMHKTLELVNTIPMQSNDVSSIHFALMNTTNDVIVDNIQITAGGIDDVPSVTDSCQLSVVKDGKYSIRFNAGFNGKLANVKEVGYKVVATWNDGSEKSHTYVKGSNTVFTSILAEVDGTIEEYTAEALGGDYIFALAIDDVPATEGMPITFAFTSYVKTESATIYGATKTVTITYDGTALTHS